MTLSLVGPLLTFVLGGMATAFALLGSPFTIVSPMGYLLTSVGVAPGVAISVVASALGVRAAIQRKQPIWRTVLIAWALLVVVAAGVIAVWFNSADLPWFFPLLALPLANLLYWVTHS